tara:strand:+ start:1351 stop:1542 length:192 start_codon:yes stop_codon:yes gene_type:complete
MAKSNPQLVRALVRQAPEATSTKQAKKVVRAAFREVYGPEWFATTSTKKLKARVQKAYIAGTL